MVTLFMIIGIKLISHEPHAFLTEQASLPVNASFVDHTIQFEVETLKPDDSGENYFVNYRLKREQFRQESKAMLAELLNSSIEKNKAQAQEQWLELNSKIQQEEEIENLLKIKGFKDAVVDVFPEHVTVIVYAKSLTPHEVSIIQDIVVRVTKVRLDKIAVSAKK
ncbi:SpoIIIAH-like family protein [Desulfosporosinus orientis]|uniref:SpoIIIAH-like family protein n=1 Tax=Desulfosporosinus orientis TaxID=1563 RepID=UPI001FA71EC0|nr:SpoIIIAH-like family protein [Desulfosporosinus orientis]